MHTHTHKHTAVHSVRWQQSATFCKSVRSTDVNTFSQDQGRGEDQHFSRSSTGMVLRKAAKQNAQLFLSLPRDAHTVKRGVAIVSRPSVCLSITLIYRGHIG